MGRVGEECTEIPYTALPLFCKSKLKVKIVLKFKFKKLKRRIVAGRDLMTNMVSSPPLGYYYFWI